MNEQTKTLAQQLVEVQEKARAMRCAAFVNYQPTVAGIRLQPITLASYNALVATGNGFVTGAGVGLYDVINFVWLHHPTFGQFARDEKRRVSNAVAGALSPAFPAINDALRVIATLPRFRWLRLFVRPTAAELEHAAISEIFRLLQEARGDFPTGDDTGEPIPFANQAHILNLFRRELGVPFAETLEMPMKQVAQHYREIVYHATNGKAVLLTDAEAAIWREHLAAKPAATTDAAR